jgi:hypothetical protein
MTHLSVPMLSVVANQSTRSSALVLLEKFGVCAFSLNRDGVVQSKNSATGPVASVLAGLHMGASIQHAVAPEHEHGFAQALGQVFNKFRNIAWAHVGFVDRYRRVVLCAATIISSQDRDCLIVALEPSEQENK